MKHFLPLLYLMIFAACTHDNAEDLNPISTCETTGITYQNTVKALMDAHCVVCHSDRGSAFWLDLSTYQGVKAAVDNGTFSNRVLVLKDMPPSGPLPTCDVNKLTQWIADGAPEN